MIFVVKRSRPEVDQPDFTVEKDSSLALAAVRGVGRGGHCAVVRERLIGAIHQEDVFGLQISVDQVDVMED